MGQYYKGVIFTKSSRKQKNYKVAKALDCWAHNSAAKLMEHSYIGNFYVRAYEYLLANKYFGHPFVWVGDYADAKGENEEYNIYDLAYNFIEKRIETKAKKKGYVKLTNGRFVHIDRNGYEFPISISRFYETIEVSDDEQYEYILNFDKKCFVRIPKKTNNLVIHPLPLLCADGNQRGGGDYYGTNEELVGLWAYDRIGVGNEIPSDFKTELIVTFKERYESNDNEGNDYEFRDL